MMKKVSRRKSVEKRKNEIELIEETNEIVSKINLLI